MAHISVVCTYQSLKNAAAMFCKAYKLSFKYSSHFQLKTSLYSINNSNKLKSALQVSFTLKFVKIRLCLNPTFFFLTKSLF